MRVNKQLCYNVKLTKKDFYTLDLAEEVQKISMQQLKQGQEKQTIAYIPSCSSKTVTNSNIYLFNAPSIRFYQGK